MYSYTTPEEAIISLETAYNNKDLDAVLASKDFYEEAKLVLARTQGDYDLKDLELVEETAKLMELGLIKSILENGFPYFKDLKIEHFGLQQVSKSIYVINEKITYPDNSISETRIFLSFKNGIWKVASIEE